MNDRLRTSIGNRQIAADLRAAIQAGDYSPGDRLPGENDLMARYDVARMTARQALGALQQEGLAVARKGSGVFVQDFAPIIREGLTRLSHDRWARGTSIWSADAANRDLQVTTRVREDAAPSHIATLLGLTEGGPVFMRERRFVLDDQPVMLSTSYLPADLVHDSAITQENTGPGGTYARLANSGTHPRSSARTCAPACHSRTRSRRSTCPPPAPRSSTSSVPRVHRRRRPDRGQRDDPRRLRLHPALRLRGLALRPDFRRVVSSGPTNIVAHKYPRGQLGADTHLIETSSNDVGFFSRRVPRAGNHRLRPLVRVSLSDELNLRQLANSARD